MTRPHLSDDRLIELALTSSSSDADPHLAECERCAGRGAALSRLLAEAAVAATLDADAAFPAERLARQQQRILRRIEQDGRPGRVIAFPIGPAHQPSLLRSRSVARVAAAAAVAAFVIGLMTDHVVRSLPRTFHRPEAQHAVARDTEAGAFRVVPTSLSDEEFLDQLETALGSGSPALRPLDALTPRSWEVR